MKKIKHLLSIIVVSIFMFTFSGCEKQDSKIMGVIYIQDTSGTNYLVTSATVDLYSSDGSLIETVITDAAGRYQFEFLWEDFWDIEAEATINGITLLGEEYDVYIDGTNDKTIDIIIY